MPETAVLTSTLFYLATPDLEYVIGPKGDRIKFDDIEDHPLTFGDPDKAYAATLEYGEDLSIQVWTGPAAR